MNENNNADQLCAFVLNEKVLCMDIMSIFDCGQMFQLWDNEKSLSNYLKTNVFKAK